MKKTKNKRYFSKKFKSFEEYYETIKEKTKARYRKKAEFMKKLKEEHPTQYEVLKIFQTRILLNDIANTIIEEIKNHYSKNKG